MDQYYLMAQLPSLDGLSETAPPPITEEDFLALCQQHAGKAAVKKLSALTISPKRDAKPTGDPFTDSWNALERQLRLALGVARAEKLHKSFDPGDTPLSSETLQAADAAVEIQSPLAAEHFLSRYRLAELEKLRPADPFSPNALLYYGLKLKLLWRLRHFDEAKGRAAYRRIYDATIQQERNG